MNLRKQNDATYSIPFFMIDSADHVAGKTGLSPTVTISKNGGAFASPSGAVSELSGGWYLLAANSTDRNTLGPLAIHATAAGADPTDLSYTVVAFDPFSASSLGLSNLNAPVGSIPTTPLLAASYTAPDNAGITAIKAKTDNLPASPAATGAAMTLTAAYDAAKTAATQASVDAIDISGLVPPDNAGIAAIQATVSMYLDVAISSVLAAVSAISGSRVTVVSPITSSGDVTIQIGDDYYSADGRALVWTSASWPTLTGGSAVLSVDGASTSVVLDNATKTATVELSTAFTGAIPAGTYHFEIVATLSNGHIVTLVSGNLTAE